MMLTLLDRYIGRTVFFGALLVFAILLALFSFILFVDSLDDMGKANFGLYALFQYVVLSLPRKIYELFPATALLGATIGLSSLAVSSELIAVRAAGVPVWRIVVSVLKVSLVFVVLCVLLGEFVVPASEDMAQRGRAHALQTGFQQKNTGLWLRDGEAFINIGEVLPDHSLLRVNIYRFKDRLHLRSHTFAARARYENERWRLDDVHRSGLERGGIRTVNAPSSYWATEIKPEVIGVFAVKPEGLSTWRLYRYIKHLEENRQETGRYELALWNKLFLPLATIVMVLLAIPFIFVQLRSGRMGSRVFMGVMLGLGFTILQRGFGFFGLVYGLPPMLSASVPIVLFLFTALYLFRRIV